MLLAFALFFSSFVFAAEDPNLPLIDFADRVMNGRQCADCPGFVGQMVGANPITLGQIQTKADIVVEDCHVTLVSEDTVRTASHCLRRWTREWSERAAGDCSKAYRFYFPATAEFPGQTANCAGVISPISMNSGLLQLEPDDVLVRLDRKLLRRPAPVEPTAIAGPVAIWGWDGEAFVKRTCVKVGGSLLTPLDGMPGSAYVTVTCDGDLSTGWSGAGVYADGKLTGVVSFGLGQTSFGVSYFGENEVAVSLARCSFSAGQPLAAECLPGGAQLDLALHDRYISGIDKAGDWHEETKTLIRGRLPYAELEYGHGPQVYPAFSYTPQYRVKCYHRELLPADGRHILAGVRFNLDTFYPKYIVFAADTSVSGVTRRDPAHGIPEFNIGFEFQWADQRPAEIPDCAG